MKSQKTKTGRFQQECPRKLTCLPSSPCPLAIRRQEELAAGKRETPDLPGCPWSCASQQHDYCFWVMADQENFDDHSVKEIASLLGLSPAQIDKALQQAIQKLQSPELQEDLRSLAETAQCLDSIQHDNTPYLTYNYTMAGLAPHDIEELDVKDINSILGEKK